MTRSFHHILCASETLAATLDSGSNKTALLIVSGGNEIRSGAHKGMAQLAGAIAKQGFPVLRYDRRGIGESTGPNYGFLESAEEIAAAVTFLRNECSQINKIIAFGNCDAATALALFGPAAGIDGYILANPWVIEPANMAKADQPTISPAAVRSRYWDRLKNPRTLFDLVSGKINLGKLLTGLKHAAKSQKTGALAARLRDALPAIEKKTVILLAKRDTTARAFLAAWHSLDFEPVRGKSTITVEMLDSASHSFADAEARTWLSNNIVDQLRAV
ncbi:hydrolase 1, exosortase A system-associated [Parasphingorhabdus sp.]|uniref:hydrolase 1, exosortase A system-associated n=1 Tax=Parasphingorhabdus sp. TaxID=2709688 RepID=UPI003A950B06